MTRTTLGRPGRRIRRLLITTSVVGVTAATLLTANATSASASAQTAYIVSTSVSQRDCYHPTKQPYPSTSCTFIQTIPAGTRVSLVCQHEGQTIGDDVWWDYVLTPGGVYGYVSDWYVNTGPAGSPYRVPGVDYCNY